MRCPAGVGPPPAGVDGVYARRAAPSKRTASDACGQDRQPWGAWATATMPAPTARAWAITAAVRSLAGRTSHSGWIRATLQGAGQRGGARSVDDVAAEAHRRPRPGGPEHDRLEVPLPHGRHHLVDEAPVGPGPLDHQQAGAGDGRADEARPRPMAPQRVDPTAVAGALGRPAPGPSAGTAIRPRSRRRSRSGPAAARPRQPPLASDPWGGSQGCRPAPPGVSSVTRVRARRPPPVRTAPLSGSSASMVRSATPALNTPQGMAWRRRVRHRDHVTAPARTDPSRGALRGCARAPAVEPARVGAAGRYDPAPRLVHRTGAVGAGPGHGAAPGGVPRAAAPGAERAPPHGRLPARPPRDAVAGPVARGRARRPPTHPRRPRALPGDRGPARRAAVGGQPGFADPHPRRRPRPARAADQLAPPGAAPRGHGAPDRQLRRVVAPPGGRPAPRRRAQPRPRAGRAARRVGDVRPPGPTVGRARAVRRAAPPGHGDRRAPPAQHVHHVPDGGRRHRRRAAPRGVPARRRRDGGDPHRRERRLARRPNAGAGAQQTGVALTRPASGRGTRPRDAPTRRVRCRSPWCAQSRGRPTPGRWRARRTGSARRRRSPPAPRLRR